MTQNTNKWNKSVKTGMGNYTKSMAKMIKVTKQIRAKKGPYYEKQVIASFNYWHSEMVRLGLLIGGE